MTRQCFFFSPPSLRINDLFHNCSYIRDGRTKSCRWRQKRRGETFEGKSTTFWELYYFVASKVADPAILALQTHFFRTPTIFD